MTRLTRPLAALALFALPFAAQALPSPADTIDDLVTQARVTTVAEGPGLPLAGADTAAVCSVAIDPLPMVLTLHLGSDREAALAACFAF